MVNRDEIRELARQDGKITTSELTARYRVSRQYLSRLLNELVSDGALVKVGGTRYSYYVSKEYARKHPDTLTPTYSKTYDNMALEEHRVLEDIERHLPHLKKLPENVHSIFAYAFSEMLNNAIEHSHSKSVGLQASVQKKQVSFTVEDYGIGVFRNVMEGKGLKSEIEAIQDIMKGKTTTLPQSHSGEGIFFTSKAGDLFVLESYGYELAVDNVLPDVFVRKLPSKKRGTRVTFRIGIASRRHLQDLFRQYTDNQGEYGFDKTQIRVSLYTLGGIYISRSQARRVLEGLERFKTIVFDFDRVEAVGQAFADEIFRVFHNKYPAIRLETVNMNEGVQFMVKRVNG